MVEGLDLAGCIVTADALNTQEKVCFSSNPKNGRLLSCGETEPQSLFYDIQLSFMDRTELVPWRSKKLNSDMEESRQERFRCFPEVVCLQPY